MPSAVLLPLVFGTSLNSLGLILWKIIFSCLGSKFSQKATTVGNTPKFFKAHISVMGNHLTIIFYHIIIRLILNIFLQTSYICNKKDTKFGGQTFGDQIWFCTRIISNCEYFKWHFDGLMQEKVNSIAKTLCLYLSCTNSSVYWDAVSLVFQMK